MALRRLTAREYLVNLAAVTGAVPLYGRREHASRAALDAFAFKRAREIALLAGTRVPLHRDLYAAAGVDPAAIRSLDDFRRLPLTDKAMLRDAGLAGATVEGASLEGCILSTSSGSSGIMLTIPHRADRLWPYIVSSQRMLRWATADHYPFWYRQAYVYTSEYPLLRVPGLYPMVFIPTAADPGRILDELEKVRPHLLHTYPTVLRDLLAISPGRMARLRLRGVSVGSELSTQAERDAWEDALGGVPVRDEYSTEELGRVASQCPEKRYHLHEDIVLTEILDPDGRPTRDVGEVVGTELHNRTMPFVRYRQGDLARISDERCPCGRRTRILTDLVGRRNDGFVLADGRALPAGFLLDATYRAVLGLPAGCVTAYRLVQEAPERAAMEIVAGPAFEETTGDAILAVLRAELPPELSVTLSLVPEITRLPGGKRQAVLRAF